MKILNEIDHEPCSAEFLLADIAMATGVLRLYSSS